MKQDPSSGATVNVNAPLLLTSSASSGGFQWGVSDSRLNLLAAEAFPLGSIGNRFAVAANTLTGSSSSLLLSSLELSDTKVYEP